MLMKRIFLLIFTALLALPLAAQKETFQVVETGWGRIEKAYRFGVPSTAALGEMNVPRWRKISGTLLVDFDNKEAVITLKNKKVKSYYLMTESRPYQTRDGWTYVEYEALDERNAGCRFWLCTHESGTRRLLVLYPFSTPDTIYGYMIIPDESN